MKFGVGVIGATGYIATPYRAEIRAAADDATIVALCARRRELLEAAAREDGARLVTDDWRELVAHPEVNLILVATPDALHHEAVMACAAAGKHVVCEKPIGMNAVQAREMRDAYRNRGLGHFVPYWTRYVPLFGRAREIVRRGTLGEIRAVIYRWHNPRPAAMPFTWRDDAELSAAGSLADVGSHAYDTIRWLLGKEAVRVLACADVITPAKPDLGAVNLEEALRWGAEARSAERGVRNAGEAGGGAEGSTTSSFRTPRSALRASETLRRGTAWDYADVAMVFDGGIVGSLILSHATYLRKGLAPEIELHGTDASLAVDRVFGRLTLAAPGKEPEILETIPDSGFRNRFGRHVFPGLRRQIAGESIDHPNLEDGWRVQLFTDAAAKSARLGRWVDVPA